MVERDRWSNEQEFLSRVACIPRHGLGLSVDVYDPDLGELVGALGRARLPIRYLEIFKAHPRALQALRTGLPELPLEYHGEGVWMSQPDWQTAYPAQAVVEEAAIHIHTLGATWFNHECASKQMVGYSFGTYLPPIFTRESALVTAEHARWVQARLDEWFTRHRTFAYRHTPLLLLETPPLTYVRFGDMPYADFFGLLVQHSPCGLVLDIGHVWTAFRYRNGTPDRELGAFLEDFLSRFPLERVVQIHLAGLAVHSAVPISTSASIPPLWLDCHAAPVPDILFELLDRILAHPGLTNLKGVALEVDTKPIDVIVREFAHFRERFDWWEKQRPEWNTPEKKGEDTERYIHRSGMVEENECTETSCETREVDELLEGYRWYAETMIGHRTNKKCKWNGNNIDEAYLRLYVDHFRPFELLVWGGDLREMFPRTVAMLEARHGSLHDFVAFWFDEPRPVHGPYDFFLLKVERFVEFVGLALPEALSTALCEAEALKRGYAMANEEGGTLVFVGAGQGPP
ncbi:MAG: DUF692 family protein [Nitrospirae bacterium]|nr:MAG: DUF692 family protein [Nitrospirota bacterium]